MDDSNRHSCGVRSYKTLFIIRYVYMLKNVKLMHNFYTSLENRMKKEVLKLHISKDSNGLWELAMFCLGLCQKLISDGR
jgi:hypothetical protein